MTPIERLREAAAVPADDVTVSRTDLAAVLEQIDTQNDTIREYRPLLRRLMRWAKR